MTNEPQNQINYLKEQVTILEKQKEILFSFVEILPDHISAIIAILDSSSKEEIAKRLQNLQLSVFDMLKEVVATQKLS